MIYELLFSRVLQRIDAESVHSFVARAVGVVAGPPLLRTGLRRLLAPRQASLEVRALGLTFPSPLGVAAGLDKDAGWYEGLGALGFGFVEVGTVTALGQAGNERPRIHRLPEHRALLNSMGFPNAGAEAVAARLQTRSRRETIVGVNVGRSKAVDVDRAAEDYRATIRRVGSLADYLVLNVSSPNTPRLREMQAAQPLRTLVGAVREELGDLGVAVPLLVKIAPDSTDEAIDAITDLAVELELDGLVAVNTTIDHAGLRPPGAAGGISGAPLKARALAVLQRIHARAGGGLTLISVGGIETAGDAWERILAGATLVQSYTGFVYGGPLWPRRINRGLAARVRAAGADSIERMIGAGAVQAGASGRSG